MPVDLKRIFLEGCVLVAFAGLTGLTLHHQLVIDAFSGRLAPPPRPPVTESPANRLPVPILLDELRLVRADGALLVDARSPELYALGHIEDAVSLPMIEVADRLTDFRKRVAANRAIITYCSGFGCPDSFDLGVHLIEAGYRDVRVYEGGYPEWRDAGLPVAGEDP